MEEKDYFIGMVKNYYFIQMAEKSGKWPPPRIIKGGGTQLQIIFLSFLFDI